MKAIFINGSPRKNWNTHQLLAEAERGARDAGAETELIHLYDLNYQGCHSCFACKRKGNTTNGICAIQDELRPVLEHMMEADILVLGSPIYYNNLTGEALSFVERLIFPIMHYEYDKSGELIRSLPKKKKFGLILTMNATETELNRGNGNHLSEYGRVISWVLGNESCPIVYSCDTYQYTDYSKYEVNIFDPQHKAAHREKQFPVDLRNAYLMGQELCR